MFENSVTFRTLVIASLASCILSACGGGGSTVPDANNPPPSQGGVPTAVGNAAGLAVSQTIGAGGGRLTLEGGRVTLDVPSGALTQNTLITAQPVTNHAHGGLGQAYRFGPEGVRFAKPVTLTFRFDEGDVVGSAPEALGVAFQRQEGVWEWVKAPVLDRATRSVSISTNHFSDWSLVRGWQLMPQSSQVRTGKTQALRVVLCYPFDDDNELLAPLGYTCTAEAREGTIEGSPIKAWSVNGKIGGDAVVGTVSGSQYSAVYTAPSSRPTPSTVSVSAHMEHRNGKQILLNSAITIVDDGDYAGKVDFVHTKFGGSIKGSAQVSWKRVEGMATGQDTFRYYAPSGTTELDLQLEGCDPKHLSLPIDGAFEGNPRLGAPFMLVNTVDKIYQFTLRHTGTVTLQCGEPREPFELSGQEISLAVGFTGAGSCDDASAPVPISNINELIGQGVCPGEFSANWRFLAQR